MGLHGVTGIALPDLVVDNRRMFEWLGNVNRMDGRVFRKLQGRKKVVGEPSLAERLRE
jgi:hypothetical protein